MSIFSDFSHLLLDTGSASVSIQRIRSTLLCCPYPHTGIAAVSWLPIIIKVCVSFEQSILLCSLLYSGGNPKHMGQKGAPSMLGKSCSSAQTPFNYIVTFTLVSAAFGTHSLLITWHASVQTQVKYNHGIYTLCKCLTSLNACWCQCTSYLKKVKWSGIPALD